MICNCGHPARYSHIRNGKIVGSCNKYDVCPVPDKLEGFDKEDHTMFRGIDKASNEPQADSSRAVGKYNYITKKMEWEFFDL